MNAKELDYYIKQYMNGDNSAFDIIYEETKQSVYLSIYAIIKNQVIIEDLMQDVYMKIIDSLESYQIGTNFKAWVSRIARNMTINYYNRQKKEKLIDDTAPEITNLSVTNNSDSLLDTALNILSGEEKEIFIYRIYYNLTLNEVSNIMNIPLSTVNYIYKNTLKKIRKEVVGINL